MRLRTFILLMAAFLLLAGHAGAAPASAPVKSVPPAKPTLLRDDPLLQEKVTLEATDRPLGDVLKDLSLTLKVDLTASSQIADQRVTLRLTDQPLHLLMNRLPQLLSHAPGKPRGYYWERLDRPATPRPAFNLWRDLRSVQDEEYERDYPRREAAVLLRDLRNMAQMPAQDRAKYKGDYPDRLDDYGDGLPFVKAMRGLTDDQIDALAAGQGLPLDPAVFADGIASEQQASAGTQKFLADILAERKKALAAGQPDPHPNMRLSHDAPPDVPMLRLTPIDEDENIGWFGAYTLSMQGVSFNSPLVLDTYNTTANPALYHITPVPKPERPGDAQGSVIDLTPLFAAKAITPAQRSDIGFTLQALAQAAHINIYHEDFLRKSPMDSNPAPNSSGSPSTGLKTLKGTLPALVTAICAHWDYRWQRVGSDYLFWSRTWAIDRANDIPERLIAPWRQRLKAQRAFTLDDRAGIATVLPLHLIRLTLDPVLPEAGPWSPASYRLLRFLGQLLPADKEAALSGGGLSLGFASPQTQEAVINIYGEFINDVSDEQRGRVVMTLRVEDNPKAPSQHITLTFRLDGLTVLDMQEDVQVPKTPPQSAPAPRILDSRH